MVREARLERHLSMGQLAAAVDRSTASVRRWERDDGTPTPDVIDAVVLRLGLDQTEVDQALGTLPEEIPAEVEPAAVSEGDPIDVVPLADVAEAVESGPAPWEQPVVKAAPEPLPAAPQQPRAPAPAPAVVWPTASAPVAAVEQDQNLLQILRDPDRRWLGYIRAGLTVAVLGLLAWALLWAVPEFLDAFGDVWDSLWQDDGTSI